MRNSRLLQALFFIVFVPALLLGDFGQKFTYQGKLTDGTGLPAESAVDMTFALYTASTGGSVVWSKTVPGVDPEHGIFSVELDITTGTPTAVDWDAYPELWLQVNVDGTDLSPRERLTSAFHALNIADGIVTATKLADGTTPGQVYQFDGSDWNLVDGSSIGSNSLQEAYDGGNTIATAVDADPVVINAGGSGAEALYVGGTGGGNAIKTNGHIWMQTGNIAMDDGHINVTDAYNGGSVLSVEQTGTNRVATFSNNAMSMSPAVYINNSGGSYALQTSGGNVVVDNGALWLDGLARIDGEVIVRDASDATTFYVNNATGQTEIEGKLAVRESGADVFNVDGTSGQIWTAGDIYSEGMIHVQESGSDVATIHGSSGDFWTRGSIYFEGTTEDVNETRLTVVDPTAPRTITFPNESGTVLLDATLSENDPVVAGQTGIIISDGTTISSIANNSANWNTAYSWGDHSIVGYLISADLDDYWNTSDFTATDISNWNTAYGWGDHSAAGYLTSETDPIFNAWLATPPNVSVFTNDAGYITIADVVGTNIAQGTRTATTVPVTSSTGTDATLEIATTTLAGVMSATDKTKLDGIEAGATGNQDIELTGDDLGLTGSAVTVDLSPYLDNTDNQNLSHTVSGTDRTINISGGTGTTISVADNDNDATNELQTIAGSGTSAFTLSDGGGTITLDGTGGVGITRSGNTLTIDASSAGDNWGSGTWTVTDGTTPSTVSEGEVVTFVGSGATSVSQLGRTVTISSTDNVNDADSDPNNELITAASYTHASNTLRITEAGTNWDVDLSDLDNSGTDNQTLSVGAGTGTTSLIQLTGSSNDVTLQAGSNVTLSEAGNTITIASTDNDTWQANTQSQNGYVTAGGANNNMVWKTDGAGNPSWRADNVNDADSDPTNELQTLGISGNDITLTDGGSVTVPYATTAGSAPPSGTAGGDLSGTYPDPTVDGIQGRLVAMTAPTNGQVLKWNGTASQWEPSADATGSDNYVTGASVSGTSIKTITLTRVSGGDVTANFTDNNTTYSAGTGIDITGTTINNTAPDQTVALSAGIGISVAGTYPNFTITNTSPSSGGTVTNVTASSPLSSTGGTTPNISIQLANGTQNGYLSSTDWNTFNDKLESGDNITELVNNAGYITIADVVGTNIAQGTRTETTVPVTSSTGTDATLDIATTTLAGVMSAADKTKLDGIEAGATGNQDIELTGDDLGLTGSAVTVDLSPYLDHQPTNLSMGGSGDSRTINSSTGSNVNVPVVTTTNAGFMSTGDKTKLDGIANGANNYAHPNHTGDVTSTGDGATVIANDVVTNTKLANMAANTIKGRISSAGDPQDLTATQVRTILNVADGANNYSHPNHTGDVTSTGDGATVIANNAVTYAKMQTVSAQRLLGNPTASAAVPSEITVSTGLNLSVAGVLTATGSGGTVTQIQTENGITGGPITGSGTVGLTGQALSLHNMSTNGFFYKNGATIGARSIAVSGNGISIANGNGASGNPTISLNIGTAGTEVAAGDHSHANLHNRQHAMTSTSDHTAGNHSIFYSNGSGQVVELTHGTPGQVLKSNGTASAPSWGADNNTWQANTQAQAGYVTAGGTNNNKVWKTDGAGNPSWRADDNTTYSAGTGIDITGTTINNTAPHIGTNIAQGTRTTTTVPVTSSTGTDATLQAATTALAGVMTAADKTKLDGIEAGAGSDQDLVATSVTGGARVDISGSTSDVDLIGGGATTVSRTGANQITITSTDNNTTYSAGNGISLSGTTFSVSAGAGLTQDASGLSHTAHTGDATGASALTVVGLQGRSVASTAPSSGQVLKWNGSSWAPSADATGGSGTVTSIATNNGITGGTITTSGTVGLTGQALALHNLSTNGLIARTGSGTVAGRTITASTGISVSNGNGVSGNPTITNTAPWTSTSNDYIRNQVSADQTAGFRITGNGLFNGGSVGIGTATPAAPLHVQSSGAMELARFSSYSVSNPSVTIGTEASAPGLGYLRLHSASGPTTLVNITAHASNPTYFNSGNNVGIGTTTPSNKLEITHGTSGNSGLRFTNLTSASSAGAAGTKVLSVDADGDVVLVADNTGSSIPSDNVTGNGTTNYVSKWTGTYTQGNSQIFDNGTNVGIGTATPATKLDVVGAVKTSRLGTYGTYNSTEVQGIWSISESYPISTALDNFGTQYGIGYAYNQNGGSPFAGEHQIVFTNNGAVNAAIGLAGSGYFAGNVGIGTTTPSTKLDVNGTVRIRGGSPAAGRVLTASDANGNATWTTGSSNFIQNLGGIGTTPQQARWRLSWPFTVGASSDTLTYIMCNPASWNSDAVIYGSLVDIGTVTDGHGQAYYGKVDGSYGSLTGTSTFSGASFSAWDASGNTRGAAGSVNVSTLKTSFADHNATAYGLTGTATGTALSPSAASGANRMAVVGVQAELNGTINNPATMPDTFRVAALWAVDNKTGGTATSYAGYFDGDVYIDGDLNVTGSGGGGSDNDWAYSSGSDLTGNIYHTGKVGIGGSSVSYGYLQINQDGAANGLGFYTGSGSTFRIFRNADIGHISRGGSTTDGIAINASNNVGIGTVSPSAQLQVQPNTSQSAILVGRYSGYPNIQSSGDADAWMIIDGNVSSNGNLGLNYYSSGDVIMAYGGGSGGNVGIGTTAPLSPLDVQSSGGIRVTNPGGTANYMLMETPGTWHRIYTTNNLTIQSGGSITLTPATNLTFSGIGGSGSHLTIDASGNITRTTISGGSSNWNDAGTYINPNTSGTMNFRIYDNNQTYGVYKYQNSTTLGGTWYGDYIYRAGTNTSSGYGLYARAEVYSGGGTGGTFTGVYGAAQWGTTTYGLYGRGESGTGYGVYGYGTTYGVYGQGGTYAGYFNGNVAITGALQANGSFGSSGQILTSNGTGAAYWSTPSGGGVGGSGTTNRIPLWTGASTLGNSRFNQVDANTICLETIYSAQPAALSMYPVNSSTDWAVFGSSLYGAAVDGTAWNYWDVGGGGVMGVNETSGQYHAGIFGINWPNPPSTNSAAIIGINQVQTYYGALSYYGADALWYAGYFDGEVNITSNASTRNTLNVTGAVASPQAIGRFYNNYGSSSDAYAVNGYSRTADYWGIGGHFEGGWRGVEGVVYPTGGNIYTGVRGYVSGGSGTNYGVYGYAWGSGTNYGVYGYAGGGTNYAGYFNGNAMTTGSHYLTNTNTRILQGAGNSVRVQTNSGYVDVGPQNTGWSHFQTDRASFYFNPKITVDGNVEPYTNNTRSLGTSSLRWNNGHFTNLTLGGVTISSWPTGGGGGWTDGGTNVYLTTSTDKVGIGTTSPSDKLHISSGNLRVSNSVDTGNMIYLDDSNNSTGENAHHGVHIQTQGTVQAYLSTNGDAYFSGNVGIGTTAPSYKLEVNGTFQADNVRSGTFNLPTAVGSSGQFLSYNGTWATPTGGGGGSWTVSGNYVYPNSNTNVQMDYNGSHTYGIYVYKAAPASSPANYFYDGSNNTGTGYTSNMTATLRVYRNWGSTYSTSIQGWSYGDYARSAGVQGYMLSGGPWGALAYKNSSSSTYGGYFTNYTSGAGRPAPPRGGYDSPYDPGGVHTAIGAGGYGDLFGMHSDGNIYGFYSTGGRYASYDHGDRYVSGLDVHLQDVGEPDNAVLYANVSTDASVQSGGFGRLESGTRRVEFDVTFQKVISSEIPVVVTVSPLGCCNGVYISEIDETGFTVVENNGGRSDIQFTWIALGRRAGHESPNLPREVVEVDYNYKIYRGLHNDGDTRTDGEGLYFENGELVVGVHESLIPDPNFVSMKQEFTDNPGKHSYSEWESIFGSFDKEIGISESQFNSMVLDHNNQDPANASKDDSGKNMSSRSYGECETMFGSYGKEIGMSEEEYNHQIASAQPDEAFFDEFGSQIPVEWVEELKAEGVPMFTYEQAQEMRKQRYLDNAKAKRQRPEPLTEPPVLPPLSVAAEPPYQETHNGQDPPKWTTEPGWIEDATYHGHHATAPEKERMIANGTWKWDSDTKTIEEITEPVHVEEPLQVWFDEFGNQIPPEWVEELKAEGTKMFTYEQAQQRRKQQYLDDAKAAKNAPVSAPQPGEERKTDDVRVLPVESRFDIVSKHINTRTGEIVYKTKDGKFLDKEGNSISSEQVEILESTVEEPSRKLVNPSTSSAAKPADEPGETAE